ncbi:reverse transcriptase domain-containing protein [Tanacetum coccineum]|uniref:Reverse transcriptase domain-containing protein n=1 Tax=Tanacetum coccineum TaxID=301880 RepID=A0ABQ5EVQ1_9ASTR
MKLNPKKCSFSMEEGPFLGHLITRQGIRANPSKVKAVNDLVQPKTLKDIQSLNGKLAALTRFLSKGAEKSLPFFKVLKNCADKNTIQWTKEAEEAFQKMKNFMEILPTLTASIKGKVLVMYLTVSTESISVVLLAEKEGKQIPIYFVFPSTYGDSLNECIHQENTRKSREIKMSGKWAIELGEHDIEFRERDPTEKETPKYFAIKMPTEDKNMVRRSKTKKENNAWRLYTDGASSSDGSGAGLMLISPEGKEYTYALRFGFQATNNEAE